MPERSDQSAFTHSSDLLASLSRAGLFYLTLIRRLDATTIDQLTDATGITYGSYLTILACIGAQACGRLPLDVNEETYDLKESEWEFYALQAIAFAKTLDQDPIEIPDDFNEFSGITIRMP